MSQCVSYKNVSHSCSISQLQKGPVQLPAFRLSPHLSDRQQDSSVNLKPSEVRLSQPRPDTSPVPGEPSGPTQHGLQRHDSEPGLRGILKKSCSGDGSRTEAALKDAPFTHEQNGGGCEDAGNQRRMESVERQDISVPPRRERRQASAGEGGFPAAAPWRQRARTRRETIACTPIRALSEPDTPQEEGDSWTKLQEQLVSTVEHTGRVQ